MHKSNKPLIIFHGLLHCRPLALVGESVLFAEKFQEILKSILFFKKKTNKPHLLGLLFLHLLLVLFLFVELSDEIVEHILSVARLIHVLEAGVLRVLRGE